MDQKLIPYEIVLQALRDSETERIRRMHQLNEIKHAMAQAAKAYKDFRMNPDNDELGVILGNKMQILLFKVDK